MGRTAVTGCLLGLAERLALANALRSYTTGGACATGLERLKGSIELGKLAALVVLDRDRFSVAVDELREVAPTATMLGGAWEFDAQ